MPTHQVWILTSQHGDWVMKEFAESHEEAKNIIHRLKKDGFAFVDWTILEVKTVEATPDA